MQNVTDLLRILGLGMIVPNKSDALNIESDCRPHSSSDPPDGGPPSPRGKAWRLRRILTAKSEFDPQQERYRAGYLRAKSRLRRLRSETRLRAQRAVTKCTAPCTHWLRALAR